MLAQSRIAAVLLCSAAFLAGCSSATVTTSTPRPTARPSPTVRASAPPSPIAIPAGPYAVVLTNAPRQGASYDVLVIDVQGQVVARVTAKLPLLKANQTLSLPLASASNDLVYYLDGDTTIRSLSPSGATALIKTIAAGSGSILGFAVSPDDQRIAVALINQATDPTKDNGRGYVEDVADSHNHVDLFNNTSLDALRWPVGWHGSELIDAVGNQCGGPYGSSNSGSCAGSYHVIDASSGARRATLCETPATQPANASLSFSPSGLPAPGGVACTRTEYYTDSSGNQEGDIQAVDWSGRVTEVLSAGRSGQLAYGGCFLAPGAAQMVCSESTSQALTLLARGAPPHNLGRRYTVLGWLDATHVLVNIDSKTLAVLDVGSGTAVNVALPDADKVTMVATQPGGL